MYYITNHRPAINTKCTDVCSHKKNALTILPPININCTDYVYLILTTDQQSIQNALTNVTAIKIKCTDNINSHQYNM